MTRKMKDSGVEWIGEIPEEWDTFRIAKIAEFINGYAFSSEELKEDEEVAVIRIGDIKEKGIDYISCLKYPNCESLNNFMIHDNDILIAMSGATAGKSSYITNVKKAYINQRVGIIRGGENSKFIYYCLNNNSFNSYVNLLAGGSAQPNISAKNILEYRIPKILLKEQKKIVSYLDEKCNKIDQTIEKEKQVIEKLKEYKQSVITEAVTKGLNPDVKMKDSGVEWIGEIPEHWQVVKLKQVFSFRKGLSITKDNLVEKGVKVISYGQIHSKNNNGVSIDDSLIRYVGNEYLEMGKQSLVLKNDFIFADTSEDLEGAGNCVFVDSDEEIFAGYHTIILAPIKRESIPNWRYFAYLYKTDCWRSQIRSRVSGIKLFSITQKILKQAEVIMPDINEQQKIIDYLDNKCSSIDKLISNKEKVIDKLTEYKKSLIYECVTGKREVQ